MNILAKGLMDILEPRACAKSEWMALKLLITQDFSPRCGSILYFNSFHQGEACSKLLHAAATAAKLLQSCPTLCDPVDGSPPGSPIPGILQARTLEWVAISFSNAWKWKVKVKSVSRARLSATPWTATYQAPPSMGFSRQEYWSGVPLPSPKLLHIWPVLPWFITCRTLLVLPLSFPSHTEGFAPSYHLHSSIIFPLSHNQAVLFIFLCLLCFWSFKFC